MSCRSFAPQSQLIRLTADNASGQVIARFDCLTYPHSDSPVIGRSAYLCPNAKCVEEALKGTRLKFALSGRKVKGQASKRSITWPLESQLINVLLSKFTDRAQTCQNTQGKATSPIATQQPPKAGSAERDKAGAKTNK
ncbi:MAG: YlxR family protein [Candidatus Obscuribacterales bacterium]|nr:YlxR family protein [Candidatus Obscuribacterales bacterium]